jgi:hypothetical protein
MTGRALLLNEQQYGITVAVQPRFDQPLPVAAGFALAPQLLARARPVADLAAGEGFFQRLLEARLDCDGDAILLKVEQQGPACHTGRPSCFYNAIRDQRVCVISVAQ